MKISPKTIEFPCEIKDKILKLVNTSRINIDFIDGNAIKISNTNLAVEPFKQFSHLGGSAEECRRVLQFLNQLGCTDYGISFYLQKKIIQAPNSLESMLDYISANFKGLGMKFINLASAKDLKKLMKIN